MDRGRHVPAAAFHAVKRPQLTPRGRTTRNRILMAARRLFALKGIRDTSVEDILRASKTGKSQFYHYFTSKDDLVRTTLRQLRLEGVPHRDSPHGSLDSWDRIASWFDDIVQATARAIAQRTPDAGSALALQHIDPESAVARELGRTILLRRRLLHRGLRRLARSGKLGQEADPARLASFAASAIEGGIRLAHLERSTTVLEHALAETLDRLESYACDPDRRPSRPDDAG